MSVREPARTALAREMAEATAARRSGEIGVAWAHLEPAPVLSQRWGWPHVRVRFATLRLATRTRDLRDGLGQDVRLLAAAPDSITGRYPVGNCGRADVSMFAPMVVPTELERLLEASR